MKRLLFLMGIGIVFPLVSQPREHPATNESTDTSEPATRELATYIAYLQQSGQLLPKQEDRRAQEKTNESNNDKEVRKFQEAATGIFTGMLTVIAGASAKDPVQIAAGIFGMLSTAIAVTTRSRIHDEEQPLPLAKRSRSLNRSIQYSLAQKREPFKKRS